MSSFSTNGLTISEGPCVFPFKRDGVVYQECAKSEQGDVCATSTSGDGEIVEYGYCGQYGYSSPPKRRSLTRKRPKLKIVKSGRASNSTLRMPIGPTKKTLKIVDKKPKDLAPGFVAALDELAALTHRNALTKSERWPALAYTAAAEAIIKHGAIHTVDELKSIPKVGNITAAKMKELTETGKISALERMRNDPMTELTRVYDVGPKKAAELIEKGVTSIADLHKVKDELSENQLLGLVHLDAIESKIPRETIEEYAAVFSKVVDTKCPAGTKYEIVGSFRRGAAASGDIDVVITNTDGKKSAYKDFLDGLNDEGLVLAFLTNGKTKSMLLTKLGADIPRRVDVMYAPPGEYSFAKLYFTGSRAFNIVQRQRALDLGYTLNEHGLRHVVEDKTAGPKVDHEFPDEKSVFDFLGMQYKEPHERVDGRSVVLKPRETAPVVAEKTPVPKPRTNRTLRTSAEKSVCKPEDLISEFKKKGVPALEMCTKEDIAQAIRLANDRYYSDDEPILTDDQYDMLTEYHTKTYPGDSAATEGHTTQIVKQKVLLPYEMWSMDKIKPDAGSLTKWTDKYKGPYVVSCKLDGVSGLYTTTGKTPKLYTRGNGIHGQDVSHLIPHLRLPKEKGLVIRGEIIIKKQTFVERFSSNFKNARNFVAGVVNQKKTDKNKFDSLDFVAYELIEPEMKPSQQMTTLEGLDIDVVSYIQEQSLTNNLLSDLLVAWREDYEYEIDGVVCVDDEIYPRSSGNPEHAFAFKMVLSDQVLEARVQNVIWTPSKDGYLVPRVQIEPVSIGGVTIEFATGFNAKFIVDNKIGVGAVIQISRSGDVIPHILGVVRPAPEPQMPDVPYVWNDSHVDIMLVDAGMDDTVRQKVILGFFKAIDAPQMKAGNIKKIVEAGHDSIQGILSMTLEDFLKIYKQKTATSLYEGIRSSLEKASLPALMQATNIFGRGFGPKTFAAILETYPDILVNPGPEGDLVAKLVRVKGLAGKSAEKFAEKMPEFVTWMIDAGLADRLQYTPQEKTGDPSHPLYGKNIISTGVDGKTNKRIAALAARAGANIQSDVNDQTDYVLVSGPSTATAKAEKARKRNIPLITVGKFLEEHEN